MILSLFLTMSARLVHSQYLNTAFQVLGPVQRGKMQRKHVFPVHAAKKVGASFLGIALLLQQNMRFFAVSLPFLLFVNLLRHQK